MSTIFSKIISGELPAEKVYETDRLIAIKDLYPVAPVHILLIPKKEYRGLQAVPAEELTIIQEIALAAQTIAEEFSVADNYRLLTNVGAAAGQSIFHLHFHLLGGKILGSVG